MDWLLSSRPDTAILFVSRRSGPSLFVGKPPGARPIALPYDPTRALACASAHPAWRVFALSRTSSDLLDFRRHSEPNRTWVWRVIPARIAPTAQAMDCACGYPGRLLGCIRFLSAAGTRF